MTHSNKLQLALSIVVVAASVFAFVEVRKIKMSSGLNSILYSTGAAFALATVSTIIQLVHMFKLRKGTGAGTKVIRFLTAGPAFWASRGLHNAILCINTALSVGSLVGLTDLSVSGEDETHRMNARNASIAALGASAIAIVPAMIWV